MGRDLTRRDPSDHAHHDQGRKRVSTFRKTVLTTAIIGAGLATTAGSAFATDCSHDSGHKESHSASSKGCSTTALGKIDNSHSKTLIGVLDGSQGAIGANICDNLNNNKILSGNSFDL
ncbi:hypothetical protein LQ327_03285 [Actinomycetospora endophytica]|uniref:Uncharacterized protein n=1 Tax=Actinomycetospora endophytica TaxID=2291215 RepID=A0ABS8P2G8_9PSEU|nr:hypothetical protein [Actinomycetospora endophytica]MCD2192419.1 hypothetical protein [Actinomycetospora endophytica]